MVIFVDSYSVGILSDQAHACQIPMMAEVHTVSIDAEQVL